MQHAPTNRTQRLRALDQAMGVAFRPCAPLIQPATHRAPEHEVTLETLKSNVERDFPFGDSLKGATQPVFGEGDSNARLVFVGEAPGADEDRTGRPFVGAAGKKLDQIILAMGLRRADVYICNVLKARPPQNRAPLPDEVAACAGYLHAQLACIGPEVIVALGGPASKFLLDTDLSITKLRGRWGQWTSKEGDVTCDVMPTFHPAYLLRQYTPTVRGQVWEDMQQVIARLKQGSATT